MDANYVHIPEPDGIITIGYKDGEVISINWASQFIGKTTEEITRNVINQLELAIEFMKLNHK